MFMNPGTTFTGRGGNSVVSTGGPVDMPPADIALAFANGWIQSDQTKFPGIADFPQLGVTNPLGNVCPIKVAQTAIPFIITSSGSMANNGALTGLTALPATYANCYLFLPTNAIAAGSVAGWYFAQMSSTTAGTVFNNTYVSGQPFIPSSPTPFVTTGPGAFTGVSAATAGPSFTLPANSMGLNGVLELTGVFGFTGTTSSKNMTVKLGTATLYTFTTTTAANIAALALLVAQNQGATNSQVCNQTGSVGVSNTGQTYSAQDTTTSLALTLNGTKVAADNLIFDAFSAVVTPG